MGRNPPVLFAILLWMPLAAALITLLFKKLRGGPKLGLDTAYEDAHRHLSTPASHGLAYVTILLGIILFVPLSLLALLLAGYLVWALSDPAIRAVVLGGTENQVRTWLELCSFAANVAVAGVAWFAVRFARAQARHARQQADEAEHSRAAQVYLQITGRYISPEITASRALLASVSSTYEADHQGFETLGAYFHAHIDRMRNSGRRRQVLCYLKHIELLAFFEDVGTLVECKYVRLDDIRRIFRSAILTVGDVYAYHITQRRNDAGTDSLFENFTKLCDRMRPVEPEKEGDEQEPAPG